MEGKQVGTISNLEGDNYILVESISPDPKTITEYMLRVDFIASNLHNMLMKTHYIPEDGGRIRIDYTRGRKGNVRLNWSPLYTLSFMDSPGNTHRVEGVRYKLVFSENPDAVLDSVCAIKRFGIA